MVEDQTTVESVAKKEREEIACEEEEPADTTAERATIEDEGEQPRSEGDLLGMRSSDPGSPTLRRGLIQNLVNLKARVPRLTPGILGVHPAMMRTVYAGGHYVDDRIDIIETEKLMRTTFRDMENEKRNVEGGGEVE